MRIDVVNVGDGACALFRNLGEAMVVDCGSVRDHDGRESAALLESALGYHGLAPTTVVVTHFDRDHWLGLSAFAMRARHPRSHRAVQLFYPRIPKTAREGVRLLAAYASLETANPVGNAIRLTDAWERYNSKTTSRPLWCGQHFDAVGRRWTVLWPPPALPMSVSGAYRSAIQEGQALAKEHPPLAAAFERVYGYGWSTNDDDFVDDGFVDDDDELASHEANHGFGSDSISDADFKATVESSSEYFDSAADDGIYEGASERLKIRLKKNRAALQRLNNELSLVIASEDGAVLNTGDVEGWGLDALLSSGRLGTSYDVIFAPHHGTQVPPSAAFGFPTAKIVVAQNGKYRQRWFKRAFLESVSECVLQTSCLGNIPIQIENRTNGPGPVGYWLW